MKIEIWVWEHFDAQYCVTKGKEYKDLTTKTDLWFPYGAKYFKDCLGTKEEAEEMLLYLQQQRWYARLLSWITAPAIVLEDSEGQFFTPKEEGKVVKLTKNKWGIWFQETPRKYTCLLDLKEVKNDIK